MPASPQWQPDGASIEAVPRVRPVFYKDLGRFFVDLRKRKGWSMRHAVTRAEAKGLAITRQKLLRIEQGQIKHPEPELLRALGVLYGRSYEELAAKFIHEQYGIALKPGAENWQDIGVQSALGGGAAAVALIGYYAGVY